MISNYCIAFYAKESFKPLKRALWC